VQSDSFHAAVACRIFFLLAGEKMGRSIALYFMDLCSCGTTSRIIAQTLKSPIKGCSWPMESRYSWRRSTSDTVDSFRLWGHSPQNMGSVYSLDWTTGLDYWTGLLDSPKMV